MNKKSTKLTLTVEQHEESVEILARFFYAYMHDPVFKTLDRNKKFKDCDILFKKVANSEETFFDRMSEFVTTCVRLRFFDDTFITFRLTKKEWDNALESKTIPSNMLSLLASENNELYYLDMNLLLESVANMKIKDIVAFGEQSSERLERALNEEAGNI